MSIGLAITVYTLSALSGACFMAGIIILGGKRGS